MTDDHDSAWAEQALEEIAELRLLGSRIVFVAGNFNIVHPGHVRLLNFAAECGDVLVVGVYADGYPGTHLSQQLRLESVRSISSVDFAFILKENPENFIRRLRPAVVVKGKEHEKRNNPEQEAVDEYGGVLLFSSGETGFSSLDLLRKEFYETNFSNINKPQDYLKRHGFTLNDLVGVVQGFKNLRIIVLGDLIVDEYISCDALGMSQEDPTLVVSPLTHDRFVGGAGIVAAHASGFGAKVRYFSVVGADAAADYAETMLKEYRVETSFLRDSSRPTTLKQRYRVADKTLLRVSHLRQHDISQDLIEEVYQQVLDHLEECDLVIFSDFNYGVLPQGLVDLVTEACQQRNILMVADSQASSQISDVSRFKTMRLLTPTEREARLAMRDTKSGLVVLADNLLKTAAAGHILLTLGAEGILIHSPQENYPVKTDRLPAFNSLPRDVSGAGDSLLVCASMALATGCDIWRSAYLGAVGAACQVGRLGNIPLSSEQIIAELTR